MGTEHPAERTTRYVRILPGGEEETVTREAAERQGTYLAYGYLSSKLDRVELVQGGKLQLVVYYDRSWPDAELLTAHRQQYGLCAMTVCTRLFSDGDEQRRVRYEIASDGGTRFIVQETIGSEGEVTREVRRDAEGKLLEVLEYEYDTDGQICLTREIGPDGSVLDEWPS